jgi:hypothetical protein
MERINEIKARLEAATPGPWENDHANCVGVYKNEGWEFDICECESICTENANANADFIAHAPDDIAYLLAENERMRAEFKETVQLLTDVTTKYETSVKLHGETIKLLNKAEEEKSNLRAALEKAEAERDAYKKLIPKGTACEVCIHEKRDLCADCDFEYRGTQEAGEECK